MPKLLILSIISIYFIVLILIARLTSGKADNATFFTGNRSSKWYLVAFGMIGASLSGVTFISVPGWVGTSGFSYMQMIIGYMIGYFVVAFILLPIYYKHNLSSIYAYLGERFGNNTHLTGALFFICSRVIGASLRLFLVADVLHYFVFAEWGVPFWTTVAITLALIWVYTNRGGIKTIIWTDIMQTFFMLLALILGVYLISSQSTIDTKEIYEQMSVVNWFVFDDPNASNYWWKHVLGGMFVTIAMTGMDQDMMQKNLTCRNTKDAQKNMISLSVILVAVNLIFLVLGAFLYAYMNSHPELLAQHSSMDPSLQGDRLFPMIALQGDLGVFFGVIFILGLIAAAYSSADSALTALTTSVSIDIFKVDKLKDQKQAEIKRKIIHILMTLILFITILLAAVYKEQNVIGSIFSAANYTYGPLLGLFFFGILTKRQINDKYAWIICIVIPIIVFIIKLFEKELFNNYKFGFELLGINGLLCFICLYSISTSQNTSSILKN
jgi:SSS family transporter